MRVTRRIWKKVSRKMRKWTNNIPYWSPYVLFVSDFFLSQSRFLFSFSFSFPSRIPTYHDSTTRHLYIYPATHPFFTHLRPSDTIHTSMVSPWSRFLLISHPDYPHLLDLLFLCIPFLISLSPRPFTNHSGTDIFLRFTLIHQPYTIHIYPYPYPYIVTFRAVVV